MRKILAVGVFAVCACANNVYSVSYSPINREYASQLDNVALGMNKEDLRKQLPDVVMRGQTSVEGETVEALELQHNYWNGVGGQLIRDRLWFYFAKGKLVKWGQPDDWPQKADLVVETRQVTGPRPTTP